MTPIAMPADLGVYLDTPDLDTERAAMILGLAQDLCETIVTPLPTTAMAVILAVAARAFSNVASARAVGIGTASVSFAPQGATTGVGGLYLSRADKATLRRLSNRSSAFSIDLLTSPYPAIDPPPVP